VLTQRRTDATGNFYYLYNYNKISDADATSPGRSKDHTKYPDINKVENFIAKTARFSFVGAGKPYLLDAWTGAIKPIPQFTSSDGRISLTVHLAGDQAILIALMTDQQAKINGVSPATVWVTDSDIQPEYLTYERNGALAFKAVQNGAHRAELNNGRIAVLQTENLQKYQTIQDWSLTIDSIEAPASGSTLFRESTWRRLGPFKLGPALKPWNQVDPSLARVSGTGTYTGTFELHKDWHTGGSAYLNLGELDDFFTVTINGKRLPPQDQVNTVVDLGPYTKRGVNTVVVQLATTLYNRAAAAGKSYGLFGSAGTVTVVPYRLNIVTPQGASAAAPAFADH